MKQGVKTFIKEGKVILPFLSSDIVPILAPGLERIIALPEDERALWTVHRPKDKKPDDGLVRKNGEMLPNGQMFDKKWFFHYRIFLPAELASRGLDLHPYFTWLATQREFHRRCRKFVLEFSQALDLELPGFNFAELISRGGEEHVLRTLLYDLAEPGQTILAQKHTDKSFITLQAGESRPGLWMETPDSRQNIPENSVLVFPGIKLEDKTGGKIKTPLHGVMEDYPDATDQRWSIIFFAHTLDPVPSSFKEK